MTQQCKRRIKDPDHDIFLHLVPTPRLVLNSFHGFRDPKREKKARGVPRSSKFLLIHTLKRGGKCFRFYANPGLRFSRFPLVKRKEMTRAKVKQNKRDFSYDFPPLSKPGKHLQ